MQKGAKFIAFILTASILAVPLISCGEGTGNSDVTTAPKVTGGLTTEDLPVTTAEAGAPDLPALDFEGADFNYYTKMEGTEEGFWTAQDIWAETETGEPINDAVYRRNRIVEDKYNLVIKQTRGNMGVQESYSMYNELSKLVLAGDNIFDVIMPTMQDLAYLARDKMLVDLATLEHIGLDKPWWSKRFTEETSVDGRVYFANGDLSLTFMQAVYTILFNKSLIDTYGLENPYQLVLDKKWTFDKVLEMSKAISDDLDGDGAITDGDRVGLIVLNNSVDALYVSTGEKYVTIEKDGSFTFTGGTERSLNMMEKIYQMYEAREYVLCITDQTRRISETKSVGHIDAGKNMFSDDRALFLFGTMLNVPRMRDMETDFGILPTPLGSDGQDSYYTYVQAWAAGGVGILVTADDPLKSSVVAEEMAYLAREMITPEYYEVSLKTKFARDDESSAMLDLIYESRSVDMGYLYNIGTMVSGVRNLIYTSRQNTFASFIASKEESINQVLADITKLYNE